MMARIVIRSRFLRSVVVVGLASLVACDDSYQPSEGALTLAMTVEYDYIPGFDAGSDNRAFPEIRDNTANAFRNTNTRFMPKRDDANPLPFYAPGDANSKFPDSDDQALRTYAEDNRHQIDGEWMNYHFLSVNYAQFNHVFSTLGRLGKSIEGPVNQIPQPPEDRYSMLFWGDIFENQFANPPLTAADIREYAVEVSTHELGHQRVGLSHWDQYQQYHNSNQTHCVMRTAIDDVPDAYRLSPEFCWDTDQNTTNSCRDWLESANP